MRLPNPPVLKQALFGNAAFSAVSGLLMLLAGRQLSAATGIPATPLQLTGAILVLYAIDLTNVARARSVNRLKVWSFIGLDGLWVLGSIAGLGLASMLTPIGQGAVAAVAFVVGLFGWLQYRGLRAAAAEPA